MSKREPLTLIVYMEGGLIHDVSSNRPVSEKELRVITVDRDIDGGSHHHVYEVDGEEAYIRDEVIHHGPAYHRAVTSALRHERRPKGWPEDYQKCTESATS